MRDADMRVLVQAAGQQLASAMAGVGDDDWVAVYRALKVARERVGAFPGFWLSAALLDAALRGMEQGAVARDEPAQGVA